MFFVDDFSIIGILKRLFPILLLDLGLYFFYQPVFYRTVTVHIIRCYAGLSAVQIFSKNNTLCSKFDICSLIHDTGAFASQFQGNGSQVFRSVSHDLFSHRLAASEENIVKMLPEKTGIFCPAAGHYGYILRFKAPGQDMLDHIAGVGRIGAGFYHCSISCRQCIHQRGERQHKRIIPWAHDQCYAVRRRFLITTGVKLGQGRLDSFFPGKPTDVLQHIADLF